MGLFKTLAAAMVAVTTVTSTPVPQGGGAGAVKYCDAATEICYSEYKTPENIAIRIAIPENATAGNFDILLQIQAPKTVGWAGIAWGGVMTNNPLTVAWASGTTSVVSSRRAR